MKRAARLLALLLALGLAVAGLLLQWQTQQPAGLLVVTQTGFIKSDDPAPPPDSALWIPRTLPDNWRTTSPGLSGYGWYRVAFVLAQAPAEPWAVYLPTVGTTYQLLLNGTDVGSSGPMAGPIARTAGVPTMAQIPPLLLRTGENRIALRLRVAPNLRGGLGPLTLGPRSAIEPLYDADLFARVTLPRSLNIALIFVGLLVLLLWLRRPGEAIYGVFSALAIVWSIRNFHYTVSPAWVPSGLWEAFVLGSLGVVVLLLWLFALLYGGARRPRIERWVVRGGGVAIAVVATLAVVDPHAASAIRIPWYLACAGIGGWTIALLVGVSREPANRPRTGV